MSNQTTVYKEIASIINALQDMQQFVLVLLVDDQGLPIASSKGNLEQNEQVGAALSMVQNSINRIISQMGFHPTKEIALIDDAGGKIVIRPFQIDETYLVLVMVLKSADAAYRRWAKNTIRKIQDSWAL